MIHKLCIIATLLITSPSFAAQSSSSSTPYKSLEPAFVVNLSDGKRLRFLQVKLQALVDKELDSAALLELHMPAIRHEIIMLLSNQDYAAVQTLEGKETMLTDATKTVKAVLNKLAGKPAIEQILMTGFVIQ